MRLFGSIKEMKDPPLELLRQAGLTAHDHLSHARDSIDKVFGEGYAQEHPELVGPFIQAAALDYQTSIIGCVVEHQMSNLNEVLEHQLVPAVRKSHEKPQ